jgi:hypothetical protein
MDAEETDKRRLRAQRRYFGIAKAGGDEPHSIMKAKEFGKAATVRVTQILRLATESWLQKPWVGWGLGSAPFLIQAHGDRFYILELIALFWAGWMALFLPPALAKTARMLDGTPCRAWRS